MKYSTEELQQRRDSGQSIDEISQETGLSNWAIYKRFQRLKSEIQEESDELPETTANENIALEPKTNWTEVTLAFGAMATVVAGILLYRKLKQDNN
ncbi:MAG: hypothetical protein OEW49_06565 [Nitrosopumilus sp.]|nr:hypothetical protein [Nitrosopumilus sp.]